MWRWIGAFFDYGSDWQSRYSEWAETGAILFLIITVGFGRELSFNSFFFSDRKCFHFCSGFLYCGLISSV